MAHILAARTAMPVAQIQHGMQIDRDHVYVIAPDTDLEVRHGRLQVSKPSEARGHRHPVDVLFKSLAVDQRERAIAIVLSGTGSNGTDGLKEVRAEGGMSLVQTPEIAKFDGMPRSAIAADMADHVLAPEKMPETIIAYTRHGYVAAPAEPGPASPDGQTTTGSGTVASSRQTRLRQLQAQHAASAHSPPDGAPKHWDAERLSGGVAGQSG